MAQSEPILLDAFSIDETEAKVSEVVVIAGRNAQFQRVHIDLPVYFDYLSDPSFPDGPDLAEPSAIFARAITSAGVLVTAVTAS